MRLENRDLDAQVRQHVLPAVICVAYAVVEPNNLLPVHIHTPVNEDMIARVQLKEQIIAEDVGVEQIAVKCILLKETSGADRIA